MFKKECETMKILTEEELLWDEVQEFLNHRLKSEFKDCLQWAIIGETESPYERIENEDVEIHTYALGVDITHNTPTQKNLVEIGKVLISRYIAELARGELANKKIIVRRYPSIYKNTDNNQFKLLISGRIGICPNTWTKRKYAKHKKFIKDAEKKLDTLKEV